MSLLVNFTIPYMETIITQSIQAYVIDAFTLHAASALAAVSALRSFARFVFPLFAPAMYASLGSGRVDTVLASGF